jgi:O-antigen/teichoic acid export membrane protein
VAGLKAVLAATLYFSGHHSLATLVLLLDLALGPLLGFLAIRLARRASDFRLSWQHLVSDFRLAWSFTIGVLCKAAYTDLDKLLLARWSTAYVVGTYAAGYKMLALSFTPIRAILEATFRRQVQLAGQDRAACRRFTARLMAVNVVLGGGVAVAIFLLAPWVTWILGSDFGDSVGILRLGFLLPVLQAIHYTLGNHLTATGNQSTRTAIQVAVLVVYFVAGLIVIPLYSWRGAIGVSLACETLLGVLFTVACLARARPSGNGLTSASCPTADPCDT